MPILVLILVLVTVAVLWYIATYNRLVRSKTMLTEAWSGIDVQLKRRHDLIPNLVETVKGYSRHEQKVFTDISELRSRSIAAGDVKERTAAETALTAGLRTLFAVAEAYPELKANTNFLDLQQQLAGIESELQLARRYYNGTARDFNVLVESFPSRVVAAQNGFRAADFFELESATERETPAVKFE
ncbi:MAG: LemA family protein [Patescibacteria group bacterium]